MRMIDADATVTVQSFDPMNEEYSHDEMTVERALDFATDEGCPPTIPAIPVEWLKKQADYARLEWDYDTCEGIRIVLKAWQKEQEAQDE